MTFQSSVNINLGFGVPGELLFGAPTRAETCTLFSNAQANTAGFFFTKNNLTNVAGVGGVIGGGASSFTGSIAATVLTVTAVASGQVSIGQTLAGTTAACTVTGYGTGSGGVGTYTVSVSQTFASGAVTGSGGPGLVPAGFLAAPKNYALTGTSSGTLTPTLNLPDYSSGELIRMGAFVAYMNGAANIGDQVQYNVVTGALSAVAPGAAASAGNILILSANVHRYPTAASGLVSIYADLN
jgi:hypothetical protein